MTTVTTYNDANDTQSVTDALGTGPGDINHTTQTVLDKLGDTIEVIQPAAAAGQARPTTYYHYDADGNLDGVEDARGTPPSNLVFLSTFDPAHTTQYSYDQSDRKIAEILPDPKGGSNTLTTSYNLDGDGNVIVVTTPGINTAATLTTDYIFDNLNRKVEEIQPDPATARTSATDSELPDDVLELRPERQSGFDDRPQRQHDQLHLQRGRPADEADRRLGRHDDDRLRRGGQCPGRHRRLGTDDDVPVRHDESQDRRVRPCRWSSGFSRSSSPSL